MLSNAIPEITDPMGRAWDQPDRSEIELDATYALMSKKAFDKLAEYSTTIPTGTYVGKMWKCRLGAGKWWLVWYGEDAEPGYVSINKRLILVV